MDIKGNRLADLPDSLGISSEPGVLNDQRGAREAWGIARQVCEMASPFSSPHTWSWSPPRCPVWSSAQTAGVLCHWPRYPAASSGHWGRPQRRGPGFCWMWWLSVAGGGSTLSPKPCSVALRIAPVFKIGTGQLMRAWSFDRRVGHGQHQRHQSKPNKGPKRDPHRAITLHLQEPSSGVTIAASLWALSSKWVVWVEEKRAQPGQQKQLPLQGSRDPGMGC